MSDFTYGDYDPEDAWHPDDPINVEKHNLFERLELLVDHIRDPHGAIPQEHQPDFLNRLALKVIRLRQLSDHNARDELRIDQILEDIQHIKDQGG